MHPYRKDIEMAQMMAQMNIQERVVEWFETDFKDAAKKTTKTSRMDDGKLSYAFSVTNNSGFDFDKFSFKIKVVNKADNKEIGTAAISAGSWKSGEVKNFRSRLVIPADVKSLSFVMYSNTLVCEAHPVSETGSAFKDVEDAFNNLGNTVKEVGEAIKNNEGTGGVFGELFGTGGMPSNDNDPVRPASVSSTRTANSTSSRPSTTGKSTSGTVNTGSTRTSSAPSGKSFTQLKNEKKLNKKRLGKSGWFTACLSTGILFALATAGSIGDSQELIEFGVLTVASFVAAGVIKLVMNNKAKRIRAYEARVNQNGNTSIDDLAAYVGRPFKKTADDLQQMIADGFFPEAYIDLDNRLLVMTRNGKPIEDVAKSAALNKKAKRKAAREDGLVPESIDDLITMTDDNELKSKLKSLRMITKKIDDRVAEVPDLEKQVKDFREKYYPEVVRLTDEYNEKIADMGNYKSDVSEGEVTASASGAPVINTNVNYLEEQAKEIKSQLISLIDSVTEASENLLEKLHEEDIMDITTDIKMLQTTLASKGLLDSDFDL